MFNNNEIMKVKGKGWHMGDMEYLLNINNCKTRESK